MPHSARESERVCANARWDGLLSRLWVQLLGALLNLVLRSGDAPQRFAMSINSLRAGAPQTLLAAAPHVREARPRAWRPPVTASINSEKPIKARPSVESSPPFFFLLPNRLKTHTPMVSSNTCEGRAIWGTRRRERTRPPFFWRCKGGLRWRMCVRW
eukprot:4727212-Prymnesium_polylepis.2